MAWAFGCGRRPAWFCVVYEPQLAHRDGKRCGELGIELVRQGVDKKAAREVPRSFARARADCGASVLYRRRPA